MLKYPIGTEVVFIAQAKCEEKYNGVYKITKRHHQSYCLSVENNAFNNDFVAFKDEVMTKVDLLRYKLCSATNLK